MYTCYINHLLFVFNMINFNMGNPNSQTCFNCSKNNNPIYPVSNYLKTLA